MTTTPTITASRSATTAAGTTYTATTLKLAGTVSSSGHILYLPDKVKDRTHISLVYWCHGLGGSAADAIDSVTITTTEALLDRGVPVFGVEYGQTWANDYALSTIHDVYDYMAGRFWVDRNFFLGGSMGGDTSLVASGAKTIPDIAAVAVFNAACAPVWAYSNGYKDSIAAAYQIADASDAPAKLAGHNPVEDHPSRWKGLPLWMSASYNDKNISRAEATDKFIARAATPEKITFVSHDGPHASWPGWSALQPFAETYLPVYDATQTPSGTPAPNWPTVTAASAGVTGTDGRAWTLTTTSGQAYRLARTS